jgi:hypothetical protein
MMDEVISLTRAPKHSRRTAIPPPIGGVHDMINEN